MLSHQHSFFVLFIVLLGIQLLENKSYIGWYRVGVICYLYEYVQNLKTMI